MKRKEDMINELKPPALQRIQDSWKLELGDVYHKHKEFIKGVEKSLAIIQHQERSYGNRGLSPVSFFIGLINVALTGFMLGRFPAHYWLYQFFKCIILMGLNAYVKYKKKTILYMLDLCWIVSFFYLAFSLLSVLGALGINTLPITGSRFLWHMIFAVANGPTAWSVIALKNGMVFHSIEKWGSLFIHLSPAMVTWTMRWSALEVHAAWPGVFGSPLNEDLQFIDIFGAGVIFYLIHASVYIPWLICYGRFHGFNISPDDYDTVYQSIIKGLPKSLQMKFGYTSDNKSALKPVLIYYSIHMFLTFLTFTWAYLCYMSFWVHTLFVATCFTLSAWWGSMTYFNMMTTFYQSRFNKYLKGLKEAHMKGGGKDVEYIEKEMRNTIMVRRKTKNSFVDEKSVALNILGEEEQEVTQV